MAQQIVIGIDPDVTANGVACVDVAARSVKPIRRADRCTS